MQSSRIPEQFSRWRRRLERQPRYWQIRFQRLVQWLGLPDYTLFVLSAVATGALAGLAAVLFHGTIQFFDRLFFEQSRELLGVLGSLGIIVLPAIGMLIQSGMTALWPEIAQRKGVLEVIKAVAVRGGYIPLRVTLFHMLAPAICMGSGGTVGPEGPAAQIGAGVASRFGKALGLADERRRIFTAAGSGAAISAIFNTPLGGVFFALEIALLNDYHASTFSALLLASVTASVISRVLLGNVPAFAHTHLVIGPYSQIFLYFVLGIAAGLIAIAFLRYTDFLHYHLSQLLHKWRGPLAMAGVGLLVGICGYKFPEIYGIGYAGIKNVLAGETVWYLALTLLALKLLLVPLVLESGGFGGVFAPSLFMGAMLGLLFATSVNLAAPWTGMNVDTSTFALVGMGAVLAAINSVPLAAIMIIFEMTNDYSFILPLMLGVVGSTMTVHFFIREHLYSRKLQHAGYRLNAGRDAAILERLRVADYMQRNEVATVADNLPLEELLKICVESDREDFYTVSAEGKLTGTISLADLRLMITEYGLLKDRRLIAQDLAKPSFLTIFIDDNLDHALRLFGQGQMEELPVVAREAPTHLLGTIRRQDVINAYNRESLKQNVLEGVALNLRALPVASQVEIVAGFALRELSVPRQFIGKTLGELQLRSIYEIEVVLIRHASDATGAEPGENLRMPTVDYRLQRGDTLIMFGRNEKLLALERL